MNPERRLSLDGLAAWLVNLIGRDRLGNFAGVFLANVVNNIVAFGVTLYVARTLGAELFAAVGIALSIVMVGAIVLDFGLSIALVRQHATSEASDRQALEGSVVVLKLVVLVAICVAADKVVQLLVAAMPIVEGHGPALWWGVVGAALVSIWNSLRSIEQARQDFDRYRNWTLVYAALRLCCFVALVIFVPLGSETLILGLYALPLSLLLLVYFGREARSILRFSSVAPLLRALRYGAWVMLSAIAFTLLARMPQFALAAGGTERQVGLYSAALTFLAVLTMFNQSVRTLLLPDVSTLKSATRRSSFRRKAFKLLPAYVASGCGIVCLLVVIQVVVLGGDYAEAIVPFVVMSIGSVVTIFLGLLNTVIHAHGIPQVDAYMNVVRCVVLGGLLFVVPFTALATALAFTGVLVVGELLVFMIVSRLDSHAVTGKTASVAL